LPTLRDNAPMAEPRNRAGELYHQAMAALSGNDPTARSNGLRVLERLAAQSPRHRQALVDWICGYLRRPFNPLAAAAEDGSPARQELAVRTGAQRILHAHLRERAGADRFWPDIDLDLREAELVDFDLHDCRVGRVSFARARFSGTADFSATTLTEADFAAAFFSEPAQFTGFTVTGKSRFSEALFAARALFDEARFDGPTNFTAAKFYGPARFTESRYGGVARFDHVHFADGPAFGRAEFAGPARFEDTRYDTEAVFRGARFAAGASFEQAVFRDNAVFKGAEFAEPSAFTGVRFLGGVDLAGADRVDLTGAVTAARSVGPRRRWPAGWTAVRDRESRMLALVRTR
jgi:uncharacterized protein YjbI with pentapeptide repeats